MKNWPTEGVRAKKPRKTGLFYDSPLYTAFAFPYDDYKTGRKCFKPACGAAKAATLIERRVGGRIPVWNTRQF